MGGKTPTGSQGPFMFVVSIHAAADLFVSSLNIFFLTYHINI